MKNGTFGAFMQVRAWLIQPDGTKKLVLERKHNAVGDDLIGYICYWCANLATSKPVDHIGYKYSTTWVSADTTNAAKSAYSTTGYQFVATATWPNSTGSSKTITDLELTNGDRTLYSTTGYDILHYGSLTDLSIAVANGASLQVDWTLIMNQNSSGGTTIAVTWLGYVIELFRAAISGESVRIKYAKFIDNNGSSVTVIFSDPTSGGTTSSTNVVWTVGATAPAGADTLAQITVYSANDVTADDQDGFTTTWETGTVLTDTITLTPVTM